MSSKQHPPPLAQPRVAAGILLFDEHDRVLLVQPSYKPGWDIPGGYVEPGESPLQACVREVHEELGIQPRIGSLLVVDWAPHPAEGDKLLFVFDGGLVGPEVRAEMRLDPVELEGYAFHELGRLGDVLSPRLARRVLEAVAARADGKTLYIEHGRMPVLLAT